MRPPVEHVRVSARGREILIKVKRHTGLEHWNEICRIALCRSLANPTKPPKYEKSGESNIEIEWKTFAGAYKEELAALIILRANIDNIDLTKKDSLPEYFKRHLERGISSLQNVKDLSRLCTNAN
ncbi:DNA sulfur modification protein DndE [Geomonas azotofigens]|uniref:DNA sulfur modification protein DndE n=1 Tax=Geomonas azotofigens TaxID=2843196 RepID=UPI001C128F5E|nr:DNA sulfur modification protein DndE [Geomonas azotofigens]MBU5612634.1 DNA sulfur modification protein DndE [Geomonas azotofigens]